uniref:exodeoxyribonuclease III n=1 Tax=Vombatus ursinus TaxID=29139 RepID=A0A4X2LIZ2_VOMUR
QNRGLPNIVIITVNVNGMNFPIKQKHIAEWIKNHNPTTCCLQETHLKKDKIYYASAEVKKAGVAILISDKAKAKINLIKRDKEGNYILLKGTIDNEVISLLNIYAPNGIASRFLEEKFRKLEEEIDSKTILVGDLNLPLSELDKSDHKINKKDVKEVNRTLEKLGMIDLWRKLNGEKKGIYFFLGSIWHIHKN